MILFYHIYFIGFNYLFGYLSVCLGFIVYKYLYIFDLAAFKDYYTTSYMVMNLEKYVSFFLLYAIVMILLLNIINPQYSVI